MAINKVFLQGRLTQDLVLRETKNGHKMVFFDLAVNEFFKGESQTHYTPCVAFGKVAENLVKFCERGSEILIEGSQTVQQKKLDNSYSANFITNTVIFFHVLSGRSEDVEADDGVEDYVDGGDEFIPDGF